jgi:hypothetical protein
LPPLDCGPFAEVIENAGPLDNRVNYVIVGDGYTAGQVETTFLEHIGVAMQKRFSDPIGQPYLRYRKFVNICALKLVSPGAICGNSALGCCGSDFSTLASCNSNAARQAISDGMPEAFEVSWNAVVLNGTSFWNTGSSLMIWSGGNEHAPSAALHEGGHGFHELVDEYCASNVGVDCGPGTGGPHGQEYGEVNSTGNGTDSGGKWNLWLGWDQVGATGVQGLFRGSRHVDSDQYRPSANSMMNNQFGNDPNTSFNAVSREKIVMDIWRFVRPIDSTVPPEGAVTNPTTLRVNVIDPEVLNVDWSLDGVLVLANGGTTFEVAAAGLAPGTHTIEARAYDNAGTDLVRYRSGGDYGRANWARAEQTAVWTVAIP